MGNRFSQFWPPAPKLTEKNLPDQAGKVFIVTGASSGVGEQLAQILYQHNAKVYVAARSEAKASKAISQMKSRFPESLGQLAFLHLDLDDLTTIKASADDFLRKEARLDVLWNNAGVMIPPQGSKTKQGYEAQLGTNNVAPFLFTKLLHPILARTAQQAPANSVRVVWVSSSGAELMSPKGGIDFDNLDYKTDKSPMVKYSVSKAGNVLHASEFAKRAKGEGIVSVSLNPGNLKTELQRHTPSWQMALIWVLLYEPIYGAYTELFAGLSPTVTEQRNGAWIIPWGRFGPLRKDLLLAQKTEAEGGTGHAARFWEWSEEQVRPYV
ncbi:MAG: hypothetical protein FRX48_04639 [Lasallia pustulata]|uniref:Short-chain dehydrogenase n=1 Tax=Lasallia pustulata TaxID=136370 RepID=A0A5M8PQW1_9LECA|nr:MAG: hypothetical protein FRX48_04639 [Lasallia pustulata]